MSYVAEHSDERAQAAEKFAGRAQSIATLLGHRLEAALSAHDLSEKRLWAAHREAAELHRRGGAPTPAEFWDKTAHPLSQHFLSEMIGVIAAEEEELMRAFHRFAFTTAERSRREAPTVDDNPLDRPRPSGGTDIDLATAVAIAQSGADDFIAAAAIGSRINEVGAWWQGKLRRRAIRATAGRLLITPLGRYDLAVSAAEMRLLGEPPWSLDDRLLSAFELAHSDLRDHLATRRNDLRRRFRAILEEADGASRRRVDRPQIQANPQTRRHAPPDTTSRSDTIELG
ncbi:MAG: hypothetical protein OEW83_07140 [Acidimicrobiia bacterium]|nr:hypothetical protein [Acidimicrobiia bacterium]